jgi:hypothetical protein
VYATSLAIVIVALFASFEPHGGLSELYDRTIGWQIARRPISSIWGQFGGIEWLQPIVRGATAAFALAIAFVPRRKTPRQIAALGAAVIALFELSLNHWLPSYVIWFTPLAFVAVFAEGPELSRDRPDEDVVRSLDV